MKRYLLDTNICVFLFRNKYDIGRHILEIGWDKCYISEITVLELYYGAENSDNPTLNMQLTQRFCKSVHILPISKVAHRYAIEKAKLRRRGMLIDDFDLLIASTALEYKYVLVTENIRHMDRFSNIKIENWVNR
jgi:tRNA(fMet)-specific endonuclease VapC